ncbi:V-type proton ATPase subunit C [Dichanthelium oligosanthes]|uniref:V-type proton ATPase subunit C n=1 Tax=Dichanthelium oligosanthes TaxID=888268 RepID=A0A1E5W3S6_9POAL|nr:V-type proton ATPase subunit C [Dichanthelium oligosanthes]
MATRYWIVSLPVQSPGATASSLWSRLQDSISRHSFDTPLYRSNIFVEGVSHKIRRQIEELERAGGVDSGALTVDGVPVDTYLTRFVWDEGKYPTMSPLKEIVGSIQSQVAKIEDDMKVRSAEYNTVRSQLTAINRKQSGSLAVRDLSNLVKPEDMVTSEHLVTLLAIVSKYSQKDWMSSYESLDTFVVPRSSKKLYEDNEYALYTVTLFAKVVDNFKVRAREKGFQVRDFEYSPEAQESRKEEMEKLLQDQEAMRTSLLQWCYASYSEVFSSWMHFCAVRVFVESILRYGLPPSFLSAVLAPSTKSEKKVRSILEELCGNVHRMGLGAGDGGGVSPGWGGRLAAEGCTSTGATMSVASGGGHRCCSCGGRGHYCVNIYVNNNVQGVTNSVLLGSKVAMRDPGARVTSRHQPRRGGRHRKVKTTNKTGIVAGVLLCIAAAAAAVLCLNLFARVRSLH